MDTGAGVLGYLLKQHCFLHEIADSSIIKNHTSPICSLLLKRGKKHYMPTKIYVEGAFMAPSATRLFERFTREGFSVIQVEILAILLQGCSHQQGQHVDIEAKCSL